MSALLKKASCSLSVLAVVAAAFFALFWATMKGQEGLSTKLVRLGRCVGCDLRGADLAGAVLAGVDLRGADFSGADLTGANLEGAAATGAAFGKARLSDAVWLDGKRCPKGAVGKCRQATK